MRKALSDGTCKFSVWRFSLDKLYTSSKYDGTPEVDDHLEEAAIALLKANSYTLQSADEMYKIYYQD